MKSNWNVEVRSTCKICGKPITNSRFRTYCSKECRDKRNNDKQAETGYSTKWQRAKRDKLASIADPDKVQCLICGKWYVQVGTHIVQVHRMTCREYREQFDLEVKRGIVPKWYRKEKGEQALENGTFKNLKAGAKYRFKKGDKVGGYHRSPITIERLKNLHSLSTTTKKD
jgi:predicted transcriptional regulator